MLVSGVSTSSQVAEGTIQAIDLVSRTVAVLLPQGFLIFDVHPRCEIRLNGERVKLRLLQAGDQAHLTFCRKRGVLTALSLEVTTRRSEMKEK